MFVGLVYNLLVGEVAAVFLLMLLAFLPSAVSRPIHGVISRVSLPYGREAVVLVMSVLAAQFAHSLHEGNKHRHVETEKLSDKFFHDAKRLRAERNTYITFGAMFMFLVLCQLWVIIKRTLQLEEQIEKKDLVFAAFKKQVENREEHRDTIPTAGAGSDEAAALREEVHNLKKQIERLEREAGDAPSAPPEEPSMRKRAGNSNTDKDE